jgi:uncharacterized protein (DUF433 family)
VTDWRKRIEINPEVMLGKPVIAGTRIPVEQILRKLAVDMNVEAVLRDHPRLTRDDIHAALAYASEAVGSEEIIVAGASK